MSQEVSVRHQYAALPFRVRERRVEVLLITSRETKRWVIPKGWPMKGRSPWGTAGREALQEAGVRGRIGRTAIGAYTYVKRGKDGEAWPCTVSVFPMEVAAEQDRWREADQRDRRWLSLEEAAELVDEPELRALIRDFDPKSLKRLR